MIENLPNFDGLEVTINTTQQCNLRCKYCYEEKQKGDISIDTVKKFIDIILSDPDPAFLKGTRLEKMYNSIILDLIGGDALVNPSLLDNIIRYFQYSLIKHNHRAKNNWRISICTNGTLFENPEVRSFLEKWKDNISITVSIDGCPEIHDLNRIFSNGKGSMDTIRKWWPWFQQTFPIDSKITKSTLSRNSIPYMYKSLVFMHEVLGINYINQNFIMEDTHCTDEDYKLLEDQMEKCCNYVLQHKDELYWSMIEKNRFTCSDGSLEKSPMTESYCGSGCMPTLSIDGNIYPCLRWLPISQHNKKLDFAIVGDVERGLYNKKALKYIQEKSKRVSCTTNSECFSCKYEPSCAYCIAGCYSEFGEFKRTTYICKIMKIQCKWAEKYWEALNEKKVSVR